MSYKKHKGNPNLKLRDTILWIILIALLICTLWMAFRDLFVYRNTVSGNLNQFSGGYTVRTIRTHRNFSYLVFLDNGDKLVVLPELVRDNSFADNDTELSFSYSAPKRPFYNAYTAVAIAHTDGSAVILSQNDAVREAMIAGVLECLLSAVLAGVMYFISPFFLHRQRKHPSKRKL